MAENVIAETASQLLPLSLIHQTATCSAWETRQNTAVPATDSMSMSRTELLQFQHRRPLQLLPQAQPQLLALVPLVSPLDGSTPAAIPKVPLVVLFLQSNSQIATPTALRVVSRPVRVSATQLRVWSSGHNVSVTTFSTTAQPLLRTPSATWPALVTLLRIVVQVIA